MLRRLVAVTTTALIAGVALSAPSYGARPAPVRITGSNAAFSPNGDGSKDVGVVRYQLGRRADVTVLISNGRGTVASRHVGRANRGTHYFTWSGVSRGTVVPDASYVVTVAARKTKHSRASVARTRLSVDARYTPATGTVRLSSDTVYPRTTAIHDVVVGDFVGRFDQLYDCRVPDGKTDLTPRTQVIDQRNRIIDSRDMTITYSDPNGVNERGRFTWDGRDSANRIVPTASYRIRGVCGRDAAGNPRTVTPSVRVSVSTQKLVARTTTTTVAAASPHRFSECAYSGALGCGYNTVDPQSSTRFPGGLTYDPTAHQCNPGPCNVSNVFVMPFEGRRTPSDRLSVTAHGGPPTAGGTGAGTLSAGSFGEVSHIHRREARMTGDTTATVSTTFVSDTEIPEVDGSGLQWSFGVGGTSAAYDLASFDITTTTYVPAS